MPSRHLDPEQARRYADYRYDFNRKSLAGRVVLVPGGAGGLGAAITALLVQDGAIPVVGSQRPKTLARCTSSAARYAQAPPRVYSCSTRIGCPGAAGAEGWMRTRAWILVFSSVLRTKSSPSSGRPCH